MQKMSGKYFKGIVVGNNMFKTVVVKVNSYSKHYKYEKFIIKSKRFKVHDENGLSSLGDVVLIKECRPISKLKKWKLYDIILKSGV